MAWNKIWEKVFNEQEWGKYPSEHLIRFIAKNLYQMDRKNIKILEVGCGTGANIWYMAREGFDVFGIDGSTTAIQKAQNRLRNEKLDAHLKVGDIINLPYNNNYFNAVIDNECIYCNNINDSKIILKEIKRVLKANGLFFSRTFTNKMYIGTSNIKIANLEYTNISDGPLSGKGFVRLLDEEGIQNLYGKYFNIKSVDILDYTLNNKSIRISEWIIICQK